MAGLFAWQNQCFQNKVTIWQKNGPFSKSIQLALPGKNYKTLVIGFPLIQTNRALGEIFIVFPQWFGNGPI